MLFLKSAWCNTVDLIKPLIHMFRGVLAHYCIVVAFALFPITLIYLTFGVYPGVLDLSAFLGLLIGLLIAICIITSFIQLAYIYWKYRKEDKRYYKNLAVFLFFTSFLIPSLSENETIIQSILIRFGICVFIQTIVKITKRKAVKAC